MDYHEAWRLIAREHTARDTFFRLTVLGYQFGDVQKALVYKSYYGKEGYHKEREVAIADMIAQVHLLCEQQGLDYQELEALGLKRLLEFISDRMVIEGGSVK